MWGVIRRLLDEKLRNKIHFSNQGEPHPLLVNSIHPTQLEKKYGGKATNLEKFWPPVCPSNLYGYDPTKIESIDPDDSLFDELEYDGAGPRVTTHRRLEFLGNKSLDNTEHLDYAPHPHQTPTYPDDNMMLDMNYIGAQE